MALTESLSPYERFLSKVQNPYTRHQYEHFVQVFCEYVRGREITSKKLERLKKELRKAQRGKSRDQSRIEELEKQVMAETIALFDPVINEIFNSTPLAVQDAISRCLDDMKAKGKKWGTRIALVNGLWKLYKANKKDRELDWDELRAQVGDDETEHDDQPYSRPLLQKLMTAADLRKKVIVGIYATAGIRRGALPPLKRKHKFKAKLPDGSDVYVLEVYPNSPKYRYLTAVTPEVTQLMDQYDAARAAAGEILTGESPLIREEYSEENINNPKHITESTIAQLVTNLIERAGIASEIKQKKIHQMHGFRKTVYSELVRAGVKELNIKKLMGHSTGLGKNYDRSEFIEVVLPEYAKAVPALTISDAPELKRQVRELEVKVSDVDAMKAAYLKLKEDNERLEAEVEQLKQKNKLRTENLEHKEALVEIYERKYLELKERLDRLEGKVVVDDNNTDDVHKHLDMLMREEPEIWSRVMRWEQDRKEREKEKQET